MKNYIDTNYRYGEVKMWYDSRRPSVVGVLVEAKADKLFFKKSLSKNIMYFSTDGCDNLIKLMIEINKNHHKGFIGIIDADFSRINNDKIEINNIFMTDGHDVEMMMINSQAWDEVLKIEIDETKLETFEKNNKLDVKKTIFNLSKDVGCVRYINHKESLGLIFRTLNKKNNKAIFIDYSKFIDEKTLKIDKDKMLTVIENKSSKQKFFKLNPDLNKELNEIYKGKYDLLEFCNGHDVINILSLSLKKVLNNKNISSEDIEKDLLISYRLQDFKKTELFKELVAWQEENVEYLLFD